MTWCDLVGNFDIVPTPLVRRSLSVLVVNVPIYADLPFF